MQADSSKSLPVARPDVLGSIFMRFVGDFTTHRSYRDNIRIAACVLMVSQTNVAISRGRGGPLQDCHLPCPAQVSKRPIAQPLRFENGSSMDGRPMRVQENSQHQCRLHCAMHDCDHAKRPRRLKPRAGPEQNKGALRCNLGARSLENKDFAVRAPRNFWQLSVPSLPACRAQTGR